MSNYRGRGYSQFQGSDQYDPGYAQFLAFQQHFSGRESFNSHPTQQGRGRGRGRGGRGGRNPAQQATPSKKKQPTYNKSAQQRYNDLLKHAENKGLVNSSTDARNWAFEVLTEHPGSGFIYGPGLSTKTVPPIPKNMCSDSIWAIRSSIMQAYFTLRQEKIVNDLSTYKSMVYDYTEEGKITVLTPTINLQIRKYLTLQGKTKVEKAIPKLSQAEFAESLAEELVVELEAPETTPIGDGDVQDTPSEKSYSDDDDITEDNPKGLKRLRSSAAKKAAALEAAAADAVGEK